MMNGAILTKDIKLLKRKWKGSPICYFCEMEETIQHIPIIFDPHSQQETNYSYYTHVRARISQLTNIKALET